MLHRIYLLLCLVVYGFSLTTAFPYKETILVTQHKVSREKRNVFTGDGYPPEMTFNLHMSHKTLPLILQKQKTNLPPVTLISEDSRDTIADGPKKIKFGVYADPINFAAILVKCNERNSRDCSLKGTFYTYGQKWRIEPFDQSNPNQSHVIHRLNEEQHEKFPPSAEAEELVELLDRNARFLSRENSSYIGKRKKRQVPDGCNVVEVAVIADETVWNFHLQLVGGDTDLATESINEYYLIVFTEVDLRFSSLLEDDLCIRIYLSEVVIQTTSEDAWTINHTLTGGGIDATALLGCIDSALTDPVVPNDYTICLTRRELSIAGSPDFRAYGFIGFLCNDNLEPYQIGIAEDFHDDASLYIAHVLSIGFGVDDDEEEEECMDEDNFIMSQLNLPPTDRNTIGNPWRFSSCSVQDFLRIINEFNAENMNCLLDHNFTDAEFNERLVNKSLAGQLYDVDYQCEYTFGIGTQACIGPGENSITDIDDICHLGVWCNVDGLCQNRTRVFTGTRCGEDRVCRLNRCEPELEEEGVLLGGACNSSFECLDYNATCNNITGVCTCIAGFFDNNGACNPVIPGGLCSECEINEECAGPNTECNLATNTCRCLEGFSVDDCGICTEDAALGEDCSNGTECEDKNAVCEPISKVCVCFGDTFDNNTAQVLGGICLPKVENLESCTQQDACLDNNAFCGSEDVCVCKAGFVLDGNNQCAPGQVASTICGPCLNDTDCSDPNSECVGDGNSTVCKCLPTHHLNSCGVCTEDIELGGDCSDEGECADPDAVCSPNGICVCFGDTFDNDTSAVLGGTCLPKVQNLEVCIQDDACLDLLAFCNESMICVCREGFVLNQSNICVQVSETFACEQCENDTDCVRPNAECVDTGNGRECRCIKTFHADECGVCQEDIILGGNCSNNAECADPNAVCSPDDICVCFTGTYDNNTEALLGGECIPLASNLGPCIDDNSCEDRNAVCNETLLCVCKDGFRLNDTNGCVPLSGPCEPCEDSSHCVDSNAECVDVGLGPECICKPAFFLNKCGECQLDIVLGGNCSDNAECADPDAVCVDDVCVCFGDTFDSNGVEVLGGNCTQKVPNLEPCIQEDACLDRNAFCDNGTCGCLEGFKLEDTDCVPANATVVCDPEIGLCDLCDTDADCSGNNTECATINSRKECRCVDGFFPDFCGDCVPENGLGDNCTDNGRCSDDNAVCVSDEECVCFGDTYDSNGVDVLGGMCLPKVDNNEMCDQPDACRDVNAICNDDNVCICSDGFVLTADDNECIPNTNSSTNSTSCDVGLCEGCSEDADCSDPNAQCLDIGEGSRCVCKPKFFLDQCGVCQPKLGLGSNCTMDAMCEDINAVCDPNSETCVCFGDFYDSNFCAVPGGTCDPKIATGEICTLPDACLDVHAECSLHSLCVCIKGFYACSGKCCQQKALCEECADDEECAGDNVECAPDGSGEMQCQCKAGFVVGDCGTCVVDTDVD